MTRAGAADRLCIALDYANLAEIREAAARFGPRVGWLKVGLEAFVSGGPALVEEVARHGKVFLDLKLHDIPNTVGRSVAAAARTGAAMINVHAAGGRAMLMAAREALAGADRPLLIAVTLLTSIDARALADLPMSGHPEGIVRRLASLARECGLDGVVCSPMELPVVRSLGGSGWTAVVPGIRAAGSEAGDQKRHATAAQALAAGADVLVVGRPVTAAKDPDAALGELLGEIESAAKEWMKGGGAKTGV
jgi:orotidine-5'-phosphate decarboxylase